jgi:hypothetical protein
MEHIKASEGLSSSLRYVLILKTRNLLVKEIVSQETSGASERCHYTASCAFHNRFQCTFREMGEHAESRIADLWLLPNHGSAQDIDRRRIHSGRRLSFVICLLPLLANQHARQVIDLA